MPYVLDSDVFIEARKHQYGYVAASDKTAKRDGAKVKIPDVCKGLGVAYMTTFELLRRERARFVLGAP